MRTEVLLIVYVSNRLCFRRASTSLRFYMFFGSHRLTVIDCCHSQTNDVITAHWTQPCCDFMLQRNAALMADDRQAIESFVAIIAFLRHILSPKLRLNIAHSFLQQSSKYVEKTLMVIALGLNLDRRFQNDVTASRRAETDSPMITARRPCLPQAGDN